MHCSVDVRHKPRYYQQWPSSPSSLSLNSSTITTTSSCCSDGAFLLNRGQQHQHHSSFCPCKKPSSSSSCSSYTPTSSLRSKKKPRISEEKEEKHGTEDHNSNSALLWRPSAWDCNSSLYDSFELNSFCYELGSRLAGELMSNYSGATETPASAATTEEGILSEEPLLSRKRGREETGTCREASGARWLLLSIWPACLGGGKRRGHVGENGRAVLPRRTFLAKPAKAAIRSISKAATSCASSSFGCSIPPHYKLNNDNSNSNTNTNNNKNPIEHHHGCSKDKQFCYYCDGCHHRKQHSDPGHLVASKLLDQFHEDQARACISPRTLAALKVELERPRHQKSIKYHVT